MKLLLQNMVSVTTDGYSSLTGKNIELLKRLHDRVAGGINIFTLLNTRGSEKSCLISKML